MLFATRDREIEIERERERERRREQRGDVCKTIVSLTSCIDADWQSFGWMDSSSRSVENKLPNRNSHPLDTKITQSYKLENKRREGGGRG
jgi:hypothetical protein